MTATPDNAPERYSFSKLSSWWVCPHGYYLRYIEHQAGIGNAFASYGTFVHELMELYAKGELSLADLPSVYDWKFDTSVPEKFPYNKYVNLRQSYYQQGLEFLKTFQGYDNYKIIGIEENFDLPIDDWIFTGIVDLIFRDQDGRLIIRDYKSKGEFKNAKEQEQYARQLYLYSLYVKEKYGQYPDELQFLMFRKHREPICIPFNQEDCEEAKQWAKDTVNIIRNAFDYPPQCDEFYSQNLCNHRKYCTLKMKPKYQYRGDTRGK